LERAPATTEQLAASIVGTDGMDFQASYLCVTQILKALRVAGKVRCDRNFDEVGSPFYYSLVR